VQKLTKQNKINKKLDSCMELCFKKNVLLYRSKYSNLKLTEATVGRGLGSSEEVWQRRTNLGCNTYVHSNNTSNVTT
jgi:hypothetical protein